MGPGRYFLGGPKNDHFFIENLSKKVVQKMGSGGVLFGGQKMTPGNPKF